MRLTDYSSHGRIKSYYLGSGISGVTRTLNARGKITQRVLGLTNLRYEEHALNHTIIYI